jgi:hypothetical protein
MRSFSGIYKLNRLWSFSYGYDIICDICAALFALTMYRIEQLNEIQREIIFPVSTIHNSHNLKIKHRMSDKF